MNDMGAAIMHDYWCFSLMHFSRIWFDPRQHKANPAFTQMIPACAENSQNYSEHCSNLCDLVIAG